MSVGSFMHTPSETNEPAHGKTQQNDVYHFIPFSSNNSEEDKLDWSDSPNWIVIGVIDSYSCFLIELLCQTEAFMQIKKIIRPSKRLHEIDWL